MKLFIYYASYLYFPIALLLCWVLLKGQRGKSKFLAGVFLAGISLLAYARFIEPRLLVTRTHNINLCTIEKGVVNIAVFSDTHNGLFGNAMPLTRLVARLQDMQPDFVVIPGDLTYYLAPEDMRDMFAPLAELEMPVYVVMGNHDEGIPGPDLTESLTKALNELGVTVLDAGEATFQSDNGQIKIAGMTDHWAAQRDGRDYLPDSGSDEAGLTIYLQHNPDILREAENLGKFDLMIAGHTHGGQINLPILTCAMTLACNTHRYGYVELPQGNLFVTSGTGMVGLPMRFNVPPVIDMLNVTYGRCKERKPA